jgi:hypothetical protein
MNPKIVNPESVVLQQVEGHWQKLAALILYKAVRLGTIKVTEEDMKAFQAEFPNLGGPCLLTHGHSDSLEFRIVSMADAARVAEHDQTIVGRA